MNTMITWVAVGVLTIAAGSFSVGAIASTRPLLRGVQALFSTIFGSWGCASASLVLLDVAKRDEATRRSRNETFLLGCESNYRRAIMSEAATDPMLAASIFGSGGSSTNTELPILASTSEGTETLNFDELLEIPALVVIGQQGSAKTTFLRNLVKQQLEKLPDCQASIIDAHAKAASWDSLPVVGGGMDYGAIVDWIKWFDNEVNYRYQQFTTDVDYNPQPLAILIDEFTLWADFVAGSELVIKHAVTNLRKINILLTVVTHSDTLAGLGDAKGFGKAKDNGVVKLKLLAKRGPTDKFVPKMEGSILFPSAEPLRVQIPELAPINPGYFDKFADRVIRTGEGNFVEIVPPVDLINLAKQIEPAPQNQTIDVDCLERSLKVSFFDVLPPKEKEIIAETTGKYLTAREVYRRLKITKNECLQMFQRWQEMGLGKQRVAGKTIYFDVGRDGDD